MTDLETQEEAGDREDHQPPGDGNTADRNQTTFERRVASGLEEIADDTLQLLERVRRVEQSTAELPMRLADLQAGLYQSYRHHGTQLDALHRELLGEQRWLGVRAAFDAVVPCLDSLRAMQARLEPDADPRLAEQIFAIAGSLRNVLQKLGFVEFTPEIGSAFDPERMEWLGDGEGALGVVLEVVRPGYLAQGAVARPCGVRIADPRERRDGAE